MIGSALDYVRDLTLAAPKKPWLVVGKGPTTDYICRVDLDAYHVLSLNHACLLVTPHLAHFVDMEAYDACRERLRELKPVHCCLPWHPHLGCRPTPATLADLVFEAETYGPLWSYNASTGHKFLKHPKFPFVHLRFFSAVGAFSLLALAGVKTVHSIGVDGGKGYGESFDRKDRLANGRQSFDVQTPEIVKTCKTWRMAWTPLSFT